MEDHPRRVYGYIWEKLSGALPFAFVGVAEQEDRTFSGFDGTADKAFWFVLHEASLALKGLDSLHDEEADHALQVVRSVPGGLSADHQNVDDMPQHLRWKVACALLKILLHAQAKRVGG